MSLIAISFIDLSFTEVCVEDINVICLCSYFGRFVLLSKQLLLSQLIDVVCMSTSDFVNSLTVSDTGGSREACFRTSIMLDSETGVNLCIICFSSVLNSCTSCFI